MFAKSKHSKALLRLLSLLIFFALSQIMCAYTATSDTTQISHYLQLAQKPVECLEYVILHELIHLKERTHNSIFIAYMDNRINSLYEKLNWQAEDERICLTAEIRYFHRYAAVL